MVDGAPHLPDPAAPETGSGGRRKIAIAAAVALVLIAGGIGTAFVLLGGDDGDDQAVEAAESEDADEDGASDEAAASEEATTSTTESTTTTTTVPADVPDLVGMTLAEAEAYVSDLNVRLSVVNVASEDEASGTILSQTPAAGAPFDSTIVVNVARPPVKTFLADLAVVEGGTPGSGTMTVNATTYTHALSFEVHSCCRGITSTTGYDLGRSYTRLTTSVGISDSSPTGTTAKFEIIGDGRVLAEATVGLGETRDLDVDVSGVLRLQIVSTGLSGDTGSHGVWADPQLTSPPDPDDSRAVTTTTDP